MDTFQRIAHTFRQDCEEKLHLLEMVSAVIEGSDTIGNALQILFLKSGVYPNDPQQIKTLPDEINRLRVCIESTEDITHHARNLFQINFNPLEKFLVFNQEACYSYACKTISSIGPRLHHFSNSPTAEEVISTELFLAMHSPYRFNEEEDCLFCYETITEEDV